MFYRKEKQKKKQKQKTKNKKFIIEVNSDSRI